MEWRACERFGISPFDFDNFNVEQQALLLMYDYVRQHEEMELAELMLKSRGGI